MFVSGINSVIMNNNKKVSKQKYFKESWLEETEFKDWLRKDQKDNKVARCAVCHKTIELSTSGRSALTDHHKGKKHLDALNKVQTFFKKPEKEINHKLDKTTDPSSSGKQQVTLDHLKDSNIVTKAEIIWTLYSVQNGFSVRSNDGLSDALVAMFADSKIAKDFSMGRSKAMYVINHGLAPHFKKCLLDDINASDINVYSFDESLNDVTQTSEMDLIVRYWDVNRSQVKSRYLGSSFLGHATHIDLLRHFNKVTEELSFSKLYQISMDGPNVNLKFYKEFVTSKESDAVHSLINIGSCREESKCLMKFVRFVQTPRKI